MDWYTDTYTYDFGLAPGGGYIDPSVAAADSGGIGSIISALGNLGVNIYRAVSGQPQVNPQTGYPYYVINPSTGQPYTSSTSSGLIWILVIVIAVVLLMRR